ASGRVDDSASCKRGDDVESCCLRRHAIHPSSVSSSRHSRRNEGNQKGRRCWPHRDIGTNWSRRRRDLLANQEQRALFTCHGLSELPWRPRRFCDQDRPSNQSCRMDNLDENRDVEESLITRLAGSQCDNRSIWLCGTYYIRVGGDLVISLVKK